MNKIGFIGAGNMGSAMIHAIANKDQQEICVYDVHKEHYEQFLDKRVMGMETIKALVDQVKYIVLTIKPQYYKTVLKEMEPFLNEEHILITVAPGYSMERVKSIVGNEKKVIRTMPNTPALVGKGLTAYCYDEKEITPSEQTIFLDYFNCFGKCIKINEGQMEAAIAVTGSSPAYGYIFIEAMADAAVKFGLPRQMAYEMAATSIQGACEMILKTGKCPGELKDAVASPGGTTIEAIVKLEEQGFRNSVIGAMTACYDKAKQMNND